MVYSGNSAQQNSHHDESTIRSAIQDLKQCTNCQESTPAHSRFCMNCGTAMAPETGFHKGPESAVLEQQNIGSPDFGALVQRGFAHEIQAEGAEIDGERRNVTILHLEIANISAASATDAEDLYHEIDSALQRVTDVVGNYEGIVDSFSSDGFAALFGAPIAHENDPERAVRAALEVLDQLRPLRDDVKANFGCDFEVKIGINSGFVIAERVAGDQSFAYTPIGDTVSSAVHLANAARAGTILVGFETYQRTQPLFDYQMLPPLQIHGLTESVTAARPLKAVENPTQPRGFGDFLVPLVGRTSPLHTLGEALNVVQGSSQTQVVTITGQAGIGKSRLVNEFCRLQESGPVHEYRGYCLNHASAKPYWIVADLLRNIFNISETAPQTEQLATLSHGVSELGLSETEVIPYLSPILGLNSSKNRYNEQLNQLDAPMLQRQTYGALVQIFKTVAAETPMILVFEDLHWVDSASAEFIEHLIGIGQELPVLFVLVARSFELSHLNGLAAVAKAVPDLCQMIELICLSDSESTTFLDHLIPQMTDDAVKMKRQICQRAEGIPFYIEELVRMLADNQALLGVPGQWQVTPAAEQVLESLPGTLMALTLARYDRLPEPLRRVVQKAAVIGRSFTQPLIEALTDEHPETVTAQLRELTARKLLIDLGDVDHPTYIFQHALLQEAVYSTLLERSRKRLHGRIAEVIEGSDTGASTDKSEVLAHHFSHSATPQRAIPYLVDAALIAEQRSATHNALTFYREALELNDQFGVIDEQQLCVARIGLARSLKHVGDYQEAEETLMVVLDDLERQAPSEGEELLLATHVDGYYEMADTLIKAGSLEQAEMYLTSGLDLLDPESEPLHARLWQRLMERNAWIEFLHHHLQRAEEIAVSALGPAAGSSIAESVTQASIYNTLAGVFWKGGQLAEAVQSLEQSQKIYRDLEYKWGLVIVSGNLGVLHFTQGEWTRAQHEFEQAIAMADKISDVHHKAKNMDNLGYLWLRRGLLQKGIDYAEESLKIRQRIGESWGIAHSHLHLAQLYLANDEMDLAEEHAELAAELASFAEYIEVEIDAGWVMALISAHHGDLELALEQVEQSYADAREAKLTEQETESLRVLGKLHAQDGKYDSAIEHLQKSLSLSGQLADQFRESVALMELGTVYNLQIQADKEMDATVRDELGAKARAALTTASEHFTRLGAERHLKVVQDALDDMGPSQPELASTPVPAKSHQPNGQSKLSEESRASTFQAPLDSVVDERHDQLTGVAVSEAQSRNGQLRHSTSHKPAADEIRYSAAVWFVLAPDAEAEPELIHDTQSILYTGLSHLVAREEGHLLRHSDGMGAVFGTPVAHVDDPRRAVRTAWHIMQELKQVPEELELPISVHVGISFGEIHAEFDESQPRENAIKGRALVEAQRLARHASANQILVSSSVQLATKRQFNYRILKAEESAGLTAAVDQVAELLSEYEQTPANKAHSLYQSIFCGRESELAEMNTFAKRLNNGEGGTIFVKGDVGVGKSRLIEEFVRSQSQNNISVLYGQACSQQDSQPFALITDLLCRLFDESHEAEQSLASQTAQRARQRCIQENCLSAPILEMLAGRQLTREDSALLAEMEPDQLQKQIFLTIRQLFRYFVTASPTIVVLDDLQWIDQWSSELITYVSSLVVELPVLFVAAYRHATQEPVSRLLENVESRQEESLLCLTLDGLRETDANQLLDTCTQSKLPQATRRHILDHSMGNPYHLQEFARVFNERVADLGRCNEEVDPSEIVLPRSLNALVRSRIDTLPARAKQLLEYASTLGTTFTKEHIEAISQQSYSAEDLQHLESRNMLELAHETGRWRIPHQTLQDEVYAALPKPRRQAMHAQIAEAMETIWADNLSPHAAELAHHFSEVGDELRALEYLCLTGEWAVTCSGAAEALSYFQRAATIAQSHAEVSELLKWRIYAGLGDVHRLMGNSAEAVTALKAGLAVTNTPHLAPSQRAALYRRLGECLQSQGKLDEAREHYQIALSELQHESDGESQLEMARNQLQVAWTHFMQGDIRNAYSLAKKGVKQVDALDSLYLKAWAENMLGGIYFQRKDLDQSIHHTQIALDLREQIGFTWGVASTSCNLGVLEMTAGQWQQAKKHFERSLTLRDEFGDIEGLTIAHQNLGQLYRDQGDFSDAENHFRKAIDLATEADLGYQIVNNSLGLAHVYIATASWLEADELIKAAHEQARDIGARDMIAEAALLQVQLQLATGDARSTFSSAKKTAMLAKTTNMRLLETTAYRLYAVSALQIGNLKEARRSIDRAQSSLDKMTDELEAGRVAHVDSQIALAEDNHVRANEKRHEARAIFEKLGAKYDLAQQSAAANGEAVAVPTG